MIIVSGVGTLLGQTYPAFQDSDSDAAEIGKKVLVKGTLSINNSRKDVNVADGSIDIKEAVTLTFAESDMAVVNNSDQLMALVSDLTKIDFFKVVKIVATNENPLYYKKLALKMPPDVREVFLDFFQAKKEYLDSTFDEIYKTYGSFEAFLYENCDLNEEKMNRLKDKYLER